MSKLTETTWIPLGLAVVSIGGASMWLSTIYFQGLANAADIQKIASKQQSIDQMATDIAVIKTQIEQLVKNQETRR